MKPDNHIRPITHALGSKRELTIEEINRISGGSLGSQENSRGDTKCWDMSGNYRDIDD